MKTILNLSTILLALAINSCSDNEISSREKGSLILEFDNRVDNEQLELNTDYVNSFGETFRLSTLNYYVSNIKLTTTSGADYVVPQDSSYFLVMQSDEDSKKILINNIPAGD